LAGARIFIARATRLSFGTGIARATRLSTRTWINIARTTRISGRTWINIARTTRISAGTWINIARATRISAWTWFDIARASFSINITGFWWVWTSSARLFSIRIAWTPSISATFWILRFDRVRLNIARATILSYGTGLYIARATILSFGTVARATKLSVGAIPRATKLSVWAIARATKLSVGAIARAAKLSVGAIARATRLSVRAIARATRLSIGAIARATSLSVRAIARATRLSVRTNRTGYQFTWGWFCDFHRCCDGNAIPIWMSTAHFQMAFTFGVFWTDFYIIQCSKSWIKQTCTINDDFTFFTAVVRHTSEPLISIF
jgi:hypothetical protein